MLNLLDSKAGIIEKGRAYRDKIFNEPAKLLIRLKITPNLMTIISLILGITAVYFLFQNHYLFIIFGTLHLLADGFDGVMARLSKETLFGKYFDNFTDRLIVVLVLLKLSLLLKDDYVYLILGIYIITQTIYFLSRFKYPALFVRTAILIILAFQFYPFNHYLNIPVIAYLTTGVVSLYSLTLQFSHFIKRNYAQK